MKCYIGLGSNLGIPKGNLEHATKALKEISEQKIRISPAYKTPALLPEGPPLDWDKPYLNAVAEIEWKHSAGGLLTELQILEKQLGRKAAPRWAPRIIDLDLLTFGGEIIHKPHLQVPHTQMLQRSFVLDPLKDLSPNFSIPGKKDSILHQARRLKTHRPLIMGILNVTPDSFSDGGQTGFKEKIEEMDKLGIQIIDIGAESTRPNATPVNAEEEWKRLEPVLNYINEYFNNRLIKPKISIDTYKASIAWKANQLTEVDYINDVSGLNDPEMISMLQSSACDYILMHNLSVSVINPIYDLKKWFYEKMEILLKKSIDPARIIFDPGIGFGKTAEQSFAIIKSVDEFADLPVRTLVGHSRKSFMAKLWCHTELTDRDATTLFLSKELALKGVDILRIHNYQTHAKAFI